MAGGGITPGAIYGASDRIGAYPSADPVTPDDIAATMFWALGIDPATGGPGHPRSAAADRGGSAADLDCSVNRPRSRWVCSGFPGDRRTLKPALSKPAEQDRPSDDSGYGRPWYDRTRSSPGRTGQSPEPHTRRPVERLPHDIHAGGFDEESVP